VYRVWNPDRLHRHTPEGFVPTAGGCVVKGNQLDALLDVVVELDGRAFTFKTSIDRLLKTRLGIPTRDVAHRKRRNVSSQTI
jgi:hypothetical protein